MRAPDISCLRGPGQVVRARRSAGGPALLPSAGLANSCHREQTGCRTECSTQTGDARIWHAAGVLPEVRSASNTPHATVSCGPNWEVGENDGS
jgi:hypothetical protein